jgi:Cyclic nucleotide-binding domain
VGDGKTYLDHDLGPGEYFGERALITGGPRAANIRATTNVVLMALDRLSFDSLLGPLKDVLNQNMIMRVMNSVSWFKALSTNMRLTVARAFVLEYFETGKYCTVLDWIGLDCAVKYCIDFQCISIFYCTVLRYVVLYCTVL